VLTAIAFLILIEQGSVGLTPSVKFSYVTSYDANLAFHDTLFTYPLLQTPSAAVLAGEDLIVAEGLQLVRHDRLGVATKLGLPLDGYPVAMAFGERGDLFAAYTGGIVRVNPLTGAVIRRVDFASDVSPADFDLDAGGCVAYVAFFPRLARIALCADVPRLETIATDGWFSAVRVLPDGTLLVGARKLEIRRRDGTHVRSFGIAAWKFALDPAGSSAVITSNDLLWRIDIASGNVVAGPLRLERGVYVRSMAIVNEWRAATPRRRRASHH
jgi:hypothetical protein